MLLFSMQNLEKKSKKKNPFLLVFVNNLLTLVLQTLRIKYLIYWFSKE